MRGFGHRIRPYVDLELAAAEQLDAAGRHRDAFSHLERAHVLGQASTREHVRVHWRMLVWGWRHGDRREIAGQLLRIAGAATKTFAGLVPAGNTGGAGISAFRRLPVAPELARILEQARRRR